MNSYFSNVIASRLLDTVKRRHIPDIGGLFLILVHIAGDVDARASSFVVTSTRSQPKTLESLQSPNEAGKTSHSEGQFLLSARG